MVSNLEELTVSKLELATTVLGLSTARVGQLVAEGIIPPVVEHGRYRLAECIRKYCEHTRSIRARRAVRGSSTLGRNGWKARRIKAALEEKALSDEYIPVAVMNAGWCAIGSILRTRYLGVPESVGFAVRGI